MQFATKCCRNIRTANYKMQYNYSTIIARCITTHQHVPWHLIESHVYMQIHVYIHMYIHMYNIYIYISNWMPEKVGDESQPPNNCSVAKSTRRHTFDCFLYTRAAACITSRARFVVRPPCQKQNWISMSELHSYGLHMGADWAAESLAHGHLKVPRAHRAMIVPLPEAELNSHGGRIDAGR